MIHEGDARGSLLFEFRVESGPPLVDTRKRLGFVVSNGAATLDDVDLELRRALTLPGHAAALTLLDESGADIVHCAQNAETHSAEKTELVESALAYARAQTIECASVSIPNPKRKVCHVDQVCNP